MEGDETRRREEDSGPKTREEFMQDCNERPHVAARGTVKCDGP
jgi:hypothetical protein